MNLLVKGCLRKRAYTEAQARQLVRLSHQQRAAEGRQHAYHCGGCGMPPGLAEFADKIRTMRARARVRGDR
jgi:hypothetical protein